MTMLDTIRSLVGAADPLTADSYAERSAALAARKTDLEEHHGARLRDLRKRLEDEQRAHARAVAEAEETAERRRRELAAAALEEFYGAAGPLARAWLAEPSRQVALALRDAVIAYGDRCARELGTGGFVGNGNATRREPLTCALADALAESCPAIVNQLGAELPVFSPDALAGFASFERALADLELHLEALAVRFGGQAPDERMGRRYQVQRAMATHFDAHRELAAFDAAENAKRQADFVATYKAPPAVLVVGGAYTY